MKKLVLLSAAVLVAVGTSFAHDGGKLKREYLSEFKEDILKHVKMHGENNIFAISAIQMNETYKEKIVE